MLKMFILNPMATAVAEKIRGVARRIISSNLSVFFAVSMMVVSAATGSFPVMYNMIAEIARAIRTAKSELARVVPDVLSPDALDGVRIFASGPPGAVAVSLMM
jgi:hypothetical protein